MGKRFNAAQLRDRNGRWTSGAGAAGAAARKSYVAGSLNNESYVGTSADGKFKGVKVGAQYKVPGGRTGGGRTVLLKGIVGVSTKPNTAKPSSPKPTPKAARAAQAGSAGRRAPTPGARPRNSRTGARAGRNAAPSAGRRVKR